MTEAINSTKSSYREKLIEHIFLSNLLKIAWVKNDGVFFEISKPEVDDSGYDIIIEKGDQIRHIQLKTKSVGAKTNRYNISSSLSSKNSGCVIVIEVNEQLDLGPYHWLGGKIGEKLQLSEQIAKHSKANAEGVKQERANVRVMNLNAFIKLTKLEEIIEKLFD